jgi:acetyl-CoA C-acetyltransferase/acetyl-CoA acyltransferase
MSQIPLLFNQSAAVKFGKLARAKTMVQKLRAFTAFRPSDFQPRIGLQLGFTDPVCGLNMGETAELLAREQGITRELQDSFAVESHARALAAREKLAEEICPVYPTGKAAKPITIDNGPRTGQTPEVLAKLRPVFDRRNGTVTAANSSQITDGAVALLVMSEAKAAELGYKPLGVLTGYAYAGCDPARMGLGPVYAIAKAEEKLGLGVDNADIIEINEAFAAQVLAVLKCLRSEDFARTALGRPRHLGKLHKDRLNVNGGSIALGHPVGATGARLVLTSLKELERRQAQRALVTLCVGGGQGAALWLERI